MEYIRALVRPLVTFGLVNATIVAAFLDMEAAKFLAGPAGIALGFYFRARDAEKQNGGG